MVVLYNGIMSHLFIFDGQLAFLRLLGRLNCNVGIFFV